MATVTDSDPEFMQMNRSNGQPPSRVCPISFRSRSPRRFCDMLGVITFAMTQGSTMVSSTSVGACPIPSIP